MYVELVGGLAEVVEMARPLLRSAPQQQPYGTPHQHHLHSSLVTRHFQIGPMKGLHSTLKPLPLLINIQPPCRDRHVLAVIIIVLTARGLVHVEVMAEWVGGELDTKLHEGVRVVVAHGDGVVEEG